MATLVAMREVIEQGPGLKAMALRHANSRITLDTYTQALTTPKREAQTKAVQDDLAGANSNQCGGRREVNLLIVPLCSHGGKPDFPRCLKNMAGTTRLELATSAVTGQRSNQLNYVPLEQLKTTYRDLNWGKVCNGAGPRFLSRCHESCEERTV